MGLIVLTMVWALYLGWYAIQSKSHRQSGDTIASFRNKLATLERRGSGGSSRDFLGTSSGHLPFSLGGSSGSRSLMGSRSVMGVVSGFRNSRTPLDAVPGTVMGRNMGTRSAGPIVSSNSRVSSQSRPAARSTVSGVRKRRRDVLVGLLGVAGATLVLGVIPPLRMLWVAHLITDVLLVAYVVMLIQIRNQVAERELKVRFLPSAAPMPSMHSEPSLVFHRTAVN